MTVPYATRMERIATQLSAIAPTRTVTRTYRDFRWWLDNGGEEDLDAGIFVIVSGGVEQYAEIEPPGDFGRQRVLIIFQGRVAEDADGPALEAEEYAAMNELERLANEHDPEIIPELILESAITSRQLQHPYCWVRSTWMLWTDPNP